MDNMLYLIKNNTIDKEPIKNLNELISFTLTEKNNTCCHKIGKNQYTFKTNNKIYPFSLYSNYDIQKLDKINLKDSQKRNYLSIGRTLRIAFFLAKKDVKVLVGKNTYERLNTIISYQENNEYKIIDYSKNLVMNKEDYLELFNMQIQNELNRSEIYKIYMFMDYLNDFTLTTEFLLFTKEMLQELGKIDGFYSQKYDSNGINYNNYALRGDSIFLINSYRKNLKYDQIQKQLNKFTLNPEVIPENIIINPTKAGYIFKSSTFGDFEFNLLSNFVDSEKEKSILLSEKRYHKCHFNSTNILLHLAEENQKYAHLVSGTFQINDQDFGYHSWVELDDKDIVMDYNHNLVMNKDEYYKLYGIKVINRTNIADLKECLTLLGTNFNVMFPGMFVNYFGDDIVRNLKRNKHLF